MSHSIEDKFKAIEAAHKVASASLEEYTSKFTVASSELTVANATISKISAENEKFKNELAVLNEKLATMSAEEASASKKAAVIAASVGVEPLEIKPEEQNEDRQAVREKFLNLHAKNPKEASAFFAKNRNVILGL